MIRVVGRPAAAVARLLAGVAARQRASADRPGAAGRHETTWVVGPTLGRRSPDLAEAAVRDVPGRVLVISLIGAHPDARSPLLRRLWTAEERARESGWPVLTLRLAPLVGPRCPLWLRLRSRPWLPFGGRPLIEPVVEEDAVETLDRALAGRVAWEGWFEVAGCETLSLAELAAIARASGPRLAPGSGAWEPPPRVLREQGLSDSGTWRTCFGIEARRVSSLAAGWAA